MDRFRIVTVIGLMILGHAGCTSAHPPPPEASVVDGTVTLDGKPVPTGEIHFGMLGVPPKVLEISDGYFSGDVPVGDHQVEVYIFVEGPPNPRFPDVPTKTNVAPPKYWGPATMLKGTVKANEANDFKFKMTST